MVEKYPIVYLPFGYMHAESRAWPKSYVWGFRSDHGQFQRFYLADLTGERGQCAGWSLWRGSPVKASAPQASQACVHIRIPSPGPSEPLYWGLQQKPSTSEIPPARGSGRGDSKTLSPPDSAMRTLLFPAFPAFLSRSSKASKLPGLLFGAPSAMRSDGSEPHICADPLDPQPMCCSVREMEQEWVAPSPFGVLLGSLQ